MNKKTNLFFFFSLFAPLFCCAIVGTEQSSNLEGEVGKQSIINQIERLETESIINQRKREVGTQTFPPAWLLLDLLLLLP
jgi:hypothetical protein